MSENAIFVLKAGKVANNLFIRTIWKNHSYSEYGKLIMNEKPIIRHCFNIKAHYFNINMLQMNLWLTVTATNFSYLICPL
jgi:hypothetical protein